jgi:MYXO-CTERM domain-containing protein
MSSLPRLILAALAFAVLAPRAASATQSAELYRTQAYFYGRFEARVRYAPGEGVVSSFFMWKDGSSSTTSWHELDFEKVNATCRLQTNIWTGTGTQSELFIMPAFDICADYHTYAFEWTPDYIAWFIDGAQVRRVTGASVTEYTQRASQGMTIHFNVWPGNSSFGGTLNPSTLPVRQYISWVQYSSYANGAFQMQWREDFNGSTVPSGWATGTWASPFNLSTHNPANVSFVNGIAVLSLTADNATGFTGTPPADSMGGGAGTSGTGGAGGRGGSGAGGTGTGGTTGGAGRGGTTGNAGTSGNAGRGGTAGSSSPGTGGTSSTGRGGTGAGGTGAGTAGTGAGGSTSISGAGGTSAGAAGSGAGGSSTGTAGDGAGGSSASGGTSAAAGTSGAAAGTGGTPSGAGGDSGGSDGGCSCRAGSERLTWRGGFMALLALGALLRIHRRRR